MQRFIPGGQYASGLVIALSATLAACGGGSSDSSNAAVASAPVTDVSTATSGSSSTSTSASTGSVGQDASIADSGDKTIVAAPGTDSEQITVASAAPTTAPDASALAVTQASATSTATSGATIQSAPATRSGAGLNLSPMSYWSPLSPTFDVMKRASAWLTQCNSTSSGCSGFAVGAGTWDTLEEASLDLDADGYPKSLPAATDTARKFRKVTTMLSANGTLPGGRYTVVYDGAGTIAYGGNAAKQASLSKAGRDVIDIAAGTTTTTWLTITATTPGNYIRNIRVYAPGGACANDLQTFAADAASCGGAKGAFVAFESFPAGKLWHPQYLADLKGFRTLRFMDWGAINGTMIENWSGRPQVSNRVWTSLNGVPAEAMIDLSNTVGAEPWMNVPPHATDDYVLQFSRLINQKLSAGLKANLEYANEPWNYAFAATKWMLAQGQAAWPDEVAKGTSIYVLQNNWYARRLVQACGIAKNSGAGASARFRCVSNTQAANPPQTDQVLACAVAAKTLGQACAKSIDVVSIAPYFGYYVGQTTMTSTVNSWLASSDGGLGKLFEELTGRDSAGKSVAAPLVSLNAAAPNGAITQATAWMTGTKAVAAKYGLPMWAYEGGQHLVPPSNDTNNAINNLMIAANRDARMQGAYEQMIANWQSSGGQVFTYYDHAAVPSKSGSWGLKESMTDNSNAKWKAALEKRDSACWWSGC